jgi:hypothetical protein
MQAAKPPREAVCQAPLLESRFVKARISCRTLSRFIFENASINSKPSRRAAVLNRPVPDDMSKPDMIELPWLSSASVFHS